MGYSLGVDAGTLTTVAAVARAGRSRCVPLGDRTTHVASAVFLPRSGTPLVGEAAERRADGRPEAFARHVPRHLGDPDPLVLDGLPRSAGELTAALLRGVYDRVRAHEGTAPERTALTHPAGWDRGRRDLLRDVAAQAGLGPVLLLSGPEAVALQHARRRRLALGSVVAVYDLGGGTFEASVLRRTRRGHEVLGRPTWIPDLGGTDLDRAVFEHVCARVGHPAPPAEVPDRTTGAALARLRGDCVGARETLSHETETELLVCLPGVQTVLRLTRDDLEDVIGPLVARSLDGFHQALVSAGVDAGDLDAVLLVGGCSRIPVIARLLTAELDRPVTPAEHPQHAAVLGAALQAGGAPRSRTAAPRRRGHHGTSPPPRRSATGPGHAPGEAPGPRASSGRRRPTPPVRHPPKWGTSGVGTLVLAAALLLGSPSTEPPRGDDTPYHGTWAMAVDDVAVTRAGRAVSIAVLANDGAREEASASLWGVPVGGTVTASAGGALTFHPSPDFVGIAGFDYALLRAGRLLDTAHVTVRVLGQSPASTLPARLPATRRPQPQPPTPTVPVLTTRRSTTGPSPSRRPHPVGTPTAGQPSPSPSTPGWASPPPPGTVPAPPAGEPSLPVASEPPQAQPSTW